MEKIKEAVGEQLRETETAIIESLSSKNVQMYIVTLNSLMKIRRELLSQINNDEVDKEIRRKFVVLKKGKEMLEEFPEVKTYLAFLSRQAQLSDSYRQLETTEFSRK